MTRTRLFGPLAIARAVSAAPAVAVLCAVASVGAPAHATGLLVARFGGEWGHPMSDDLWAIYYNPAGLSLLGGTRISLTGSFAFRSFDFTRDPDAIDNVIADPNVGAGTPAGDGVAANSGKSTLDNVIAVPFFAVGSDFGVKGLGVALGFYVPVGGQEIWDPGKKSDKYPGADDAPVRWWTVEGTAQSTYVTLAAGYRIEPIRLSVGVGLNLVWTVIDQIQARNADGTDSLVSNGRLQEGRAQLKVDALDFAASFGLLWEPIDNLFIGASYQSQPNFGGQTLTGDANIVLGGGPAPEDPHINAEVTQAMPDVIRFGVRYGEKKKWQARVFADYARWSVLKEQCILNADIADRSCEGDAPPGKIIIIPRDWEDAWGVRVSGSWWANDGIELVLGVGWDGTSIPDSRVEPAFYDAEKMSFTIGGKFELFDDALEISAQFTHVLYFDRETKPRGRVPQDPGDPDGPQWTDIDSIGLRPAARVPDAAGLYQQSIELVEIGVTAKF